MEIVKNGKEQKYQCKCNECSTIFNFTYEDIKSKYITPFITPIRFKYVNCTVCGKRIYIEKE